MTWRTFGHTYTKQVLDAQLAGDRLAHAYLFTGSAGIGKRELAQEFAEKIIGQPHSTDITYYDLELQPAVEDLRHLLRLSALTPMNGQHKVVIIDHSNLVGTAAASTLLKTLEEPTQHTVFILLSDTPRLLPTIMSRCQIVALNRLSPQELRDYAVSKNLSVSEEVLTAAGGSIRRLELLAGNSEEATIILAALRDLTSALEAGSAQRVMQITKLAELDDDLLRIVIESWLHGQLSALATKPARYSAVQAALETLQRLSGNVNKKMALEFFLLHPAV